jgi:hypothetical protein
MKNCDKAVEILQRTDDGDDLTPQHLALVEAAANGWLTEEGQRAFEELHSNVLSGYQRPWLHGIENLTIDQQGYVFYKGQEVEHYELGYAYSERSLVSAKELVRRCEKLEGLGVPITSGNVVWRWEQFEAIDATH